MQTASAGAPESLDGEALDVRGLDGGNVEAVGEPKARGGGDVEALRLQAGAHVRVMASGYGVISATERAPAQRSASPTAASVLTTGAPVTRSMSAQRLAS